MSRNRDTMERVTWMLVENTVPDRLSNGSLTQALQFTSKIKKRTKIVNRELRKYSGLKSYNQYLEIKRSYLKNTSVDDESDYEPSSRSKIANARDSNLDLLAYSSAEESEDDRDYDDILIGENPIISLSGREDENCIRKKETNKSRTENRASETRTSRSPSMRNQHASLRISVQPSTSRKSTVRKPKRVQTILTNFLERKSISGPEEISSREDEEHQVDEKENSETIEAPSKTRVSPRKVSKTQPESSNKTSVQKRVTENRKLRNKTREDVKKNLSAIIGDSETEYLPEKNSCKNKLNETQDSDLNLSNMMAVAQSTQYPDDCSDISEKTEKKSLVSDFLTNKNQNQPKDSGIEDDSTEESAKLKGKCIKVIDNKKITSKQKYARKAASNNINTIQNSSNNDKNICLEAEDTSEVESLKKAEILGNYESGFIQNNEPLKEKHPPKIIGSEIVDKKYKILGKEQEGLTEIPEEEEEIDVVGMEQCDELESSSWKLKESKENDEEREEKFEQRKIASKEEHGKKSNFGKGEMKKEFEAEKRKKEDESKEEVLTDRVEDEIEESDEGLEKIKKFIIKKPIDKKLMNQERTPKKVKKSEKQSIRELEMREESSEEKSDKQIKKSRKEKVKRSKKEKEGIQEKNEKDYESHIFSSSESDFEEPEERKKSPEKQSEERKFTVEEKDDLIDKEGSNNEKQQEKRKVKEKVEDSNSDDGSESDKEEKKQRERRKVSEKVKEVSSEEDSEGEKEEVKRKKIQQEKAKVEERIKIEGKVNDSSSEEDSEREKQEVRQKEIIQQEKVKESSSEEESEDEKEMKQKEIQKPTNITKRRKVKEWKEDLRSSEEEKKNEDPKLKRGVENNDKKDEGDEADEEKDERDDNEDQERGELIYEDVEVNHKIVEKPLTENENIESNDTAIVEIENEDSSEVKVGSREIFTQFVDRKYDSESEEEKQDDEEELRLTLEHEETYVNLDDNKITIEEHKIEVPKNPDTSDEGEEVMSAKSLKKVQQMKRLDLTMGSDSSSDEEFSQAQMNQDKTFVRKEKSDSSGSESEEDVKKKSPKKKDSPKKKSPEKKEKSPKKKEIPKNLVQSSGESDDDSKEDEKEKTEEEVQPDEDRDFHNYIQEGVSFLQQQKDKEKQRSSGQAIENIETQSLESSQVISDPDTQISLETEKTKSKENRKKELETECLKYALSNLESANTKFKKGIEHQVIVDEMQELNKNEKATTENFQKMTEFGELVEKENLIEHNLPTTISFQDISDNEEVWMIQIPKKEISKHLIGKNMSYNGSELKLGENAYEASEKKLENLVCVFSSERSKGRYKTVDIRPVGSLIVRPKNAFINTSSAENEPEKKRRRRSDTQDSSVNISKEVIHPASNITTKTKRKKKKKKKKLFTQESMLDLEDKNPEDNEFESSQDSESVNSAQKRKRKHFLSQNEEEKKVEPKDDVKQKKIWNIAEYALDEKPPVVPSENLAGKKHKIDKRMDNNDEKSEDNKLESSQSPQLVNTAQKRKRKHFLSESEEEKKVEPKVDVKQKKMWNIDEYALDEKPPVAPPENLAGKKHKIDKRIDNESGSSDVGLWEEKKPKKEKLKKEKKYNQLDEIKKKSEAFCLKIQKGKTVLSNLIAESSAKKEKYNSLDISKVKAKSDKEHKESDSLMTHKVKSENYTKKKKKKKFDNWIVEIASESEQKEEKLQLKNTKKPEKRKKKPRRDSEKWIDFSTENKIDKTEEVKNSQNIELSKTDHKSKKETLDEQDSSSDFEVKAKTKNKKKSKKLENNSFFEEYSNWDDLNNQKEIELKKEKTKKTVNGLINFEH